MLLSKATYKRGAKAFCQRAKNICNIQPGLLDNLIRKQEEKNKRIIQNGHGLVVLSLIKAGC